MFEVPARAERRRRIAQRPLNFNKKRGNRSAARKHGGRRSSNKVSLVKAEAHLLARFPM